MTRALLARSVFIVSFMAAAVPSTLFAQTSSAGTRLPVSNKQVLSANPFLLMAEWANVEFERKHNDSATFGVSASASSLNEMDYRNFQGFYRYYPQGASLTGFYIGGRGGVHRISEGGESGHAFGLGFEIGYGWLFGAQRNFAVSVGAGATRLFGGDMNGASTLIPTLRLVNVGWSF